MQTLLMMALSVSSLSPFEKEEVCRHGVSQASMGVARTLSLLEISVDAGDGVVSVKAPSSKFGLTLRAPAQVLPRVRVPMLLSPLLKLGLKLELFVGIGISSACGWMVPATEMPWTDVGLVKVEPEPMRLHPTPPQIQVGILTAVERLRALDPKDVGIIVSTGVSSGVQTVNTAAGSAQHAPATSSSAPVAPRQSTVVAPRPQVNVTAPPVVTVNPVRPTTQVETLRR